MQNMDFTAREKPGNLPTVQKLHFYLQNSKLAFQTKKRWEPDKESFVGIQRNPCALPGSNGTTVVRAHLNQHKHPMGTPPVLPARHWCCSSAGLCSLRARAALAARGQLLQQAQQQLGALQQRQPLVGSGTQQQGINLLVCSQSCFFLIAAPNLFFA